MGNDRVGLPAAAVGVETEKVPAVSTIDQPVRLDVMFRDGFGVSCGSK